MVTFSGPFKMHAYAGEQYGKNSISAEEEKSEDLCKKS